MQNIMENVLERKETLINDINDSLIINLLLKEGRLSRMEIAERTGISQPSISRIVNRLVAERLIESVGRGEVTSRGGRKPEILEINRRGGYLIGLDIGSFETKIVITDLHWQVVASKAIVTQDDSRTEAVLSKIINLIETLIREENISRGDIRGLGVGCPGVVNDALGKIVYSANVPSLNGLPLKSILEESLRFPVCLSNTIKIWMIGENYFDKSLSGHNFMCVLYGVGIGLNILLNNKVILSGFHKNIWDFGHITVEKDGPLCHCGRKGCLEALAGGWAIVREAKKIVEGNPNSPLSKMVQGKGNRITAKTVIEAAERGEQDSLKIIQKAGECLGTNLSKFIQFFAPDQVIFAGGLVREKNILTEHIEEALRREMPEEQLNEIKVRVSNLDKFGAALGATMLVSHEVFKTPLLELLSV